MILYPAGKKGKYSIPEGVTSIGAYAFYGCNVLSSISIPSSVTSIRYSAFSGCNNLKIYCTENSVAHIYAIDNNIPYSFGEISESPNEDENHGNTSGDNTSQTPDDTSDQDKPQTPNDTQDQDKIETPQVQFIENVVIKLTKTSFNYNGKAQIPNIASVQISGKTLTVGTDYTVSYKNNKNIGIATITIAGKGNYNGTATTTTTFTISAKKGSKFTVGANTYKVTGSNIVSFTEVKNAKTKKVSIPKTVKIGGKNFKVTSVADNALKNNKNVISVTIGKNVTSIGKNTFSGCKKLGTITIKSTTLAKVGKNALKGIKVNAKIKVLAKKLNAYKNILKGKGQGKKVKVTK